jgi:hypothetical protein
MDFIVDVQGLAQRRAVAVGVAGAGTSGGVDSAPSLVKSVKSSGSVRSIRVQAAPRDPARARDSKHDILLWKDIELKETVGSDDGTVRLVEV